MIGLISYASCSPNHIVSTYQQANPQPSQFSLLPSDNTQVKYHSPSSGDQVAQKQRLSCRNQGMGRSLYHRHWMMPVPTFLVILPASALGEVFSHAFRCM